MDVFCFGSQTTPPYQTSAPQGLFRINDGVIRIPDLDFELLVNRVTAGTREA